MRRLFLLLLAIAMVGFSTLGCGNGGVTSPSRHGHRPRVAHRRPCRIRLDRAQRP